MVREAPAGAVLIGGSGEPFDWLRPNEVHIYASTCTYTCTCMYVTCMYVHVHVLYTCTCIHVFIHAYMYIIPKFKISVGVVSYQ